MDIEKKLFYSIRLSGYVLLRKYKVLKYSFEQKHLIYINRTMLRANKRTSNLSIERLQKTAKRATKAAKLCILTELCYKIDQVKQRQDRIPYGFVSGLVRESRSVFPWVTRDAINNHYRKIQREPLPMPPPPPQAARLSLEGCSPVHRPDPLSSKLTSCRATPHMFVNYVISELI